MDPLALLLAIFPHQRKGPGSSIVAVILTLQKQQQISQKNLSHLMLISQVRPISGQLEKSWDCILTVTQED